MIGKPNWFKIRKYGGWGLTPATKEGWIYIALCALPLVIFQSLPYWNENTRFIATLVWVAVIIIDVIDIMFHIKKDEREYLHEAIAERNVAWFLIAAIAVGFFYKTVTSGLTGQPIIDWYLAIPLFGAALVKTLTNLYLRDK